MFYPVLDVTGGNERFAGLDLLQEESVPGKGNLLVKIAHYSYVV